MIALALYTCAEPPHVKAWRAIEAMLARGETPSLAHAIAACPPPEPAEVERMRRSGAAYTHTVLLAMAPMLIEAEAGLLSEFIERRFAVEIATLRMAQRISVVAEVMRGK